MIPIKRGTARRLSLRPWWPHVLLPPDRVKLSEEDVADFARRLTAAVRNGSCDARSRQDSQGR